MHLTVSVIIVTKNRPLQLTRCLQSICRNTAQPDEIIVINEGDRIPKNPGFDCFSSRIKIIDHSLSNHSQGRNEGVSVATSDILCFTDDDCIVKQSWIREIVQSFNNHPHTQGVFGKTVPYKKNVGKTCPCSFAKSASCVISKPCYHAKHFGFGNNMAFRKELFSNIGLFKTWLGIGSAGLSAEDAEFAQRVLFSGGTILYNPKAIVFHNKWLTPEEMETQALSYVCGEMACYGYFLFQGKSFAKTVIIDNLKDSFRKIRGIMKSIFLAKWGNNLLHEIEYTFSETFFKLRGLGVGFWFSLFDPIR